MTPRCYGTLLALLLGVPLSSTAGAQQRLTLALMPTQYFSADAQSAAQVTQALEQEFERQGYDVMPLERSRETFREMGLGLSEHFGDPTILRFGRRMGADLVAHPQLLALGLPAAGQDRPPEGLRPSAVLYLRVLNARTGRPLYTRQIGHAFWADRPLGSEFVLPQQVAAGAASEVTRNYFERVAGSRQEYGGAR